MLNRIVEEGHLFQARSHIVAATARIAQQSLIIGRLRSRGLDTSQAELCLRTMMDTLRALRSHKELIEDIVSVVPDALPARRGRGSA